MWVVLTQGATEKGSSLTGTDGKYIGNLNAGDYQVQVKRGHSVLLRSTVRVPVSGKHDLRLP